MKVVLAYSGGLDTSVIVPWLRETYDAEVVCFAADVGQGEELAGLEARALSSGASAFHCRDLRRELVEDFILPTLRAGAVYGRKYLLGTAMARPLIASHQVGIAREIGADALAHGCTGKGNDQVRFELAYAALAPDLQVIAPWREWAIGSREDALAYAESRGLELPLTRERLFSRDRNLWHVSHEGGPLEDPAWEPDESLFLVTTAPAEAPDHPAYVDLEFEAGVPVGVNGGRASALEILDRLNACAGRHGVGRVDLVEDRLVGMKSRGVYETPGGTLLHTALRELEQLVLDRRSLALKDGLADRYAELVYEGRWWGGEREALDAAVRALMRRVSGGIRLKLFKGSVGIAGRWSDASLYDEGLATFGESTRYRHADAGGFIRLFSLPYLGVANGSVLAAKPSESSASGSDPAASGSGLAASGSGLGVQNGGPPGALPDSVVRHPEAAGNSATLRRMWGGGNEPGPLPEFDRLNRSLPVDWRLWKEDVRGSQAWAGALKEAGVIDREETDRLVQGLTRVARRLSAARFEECPDEDIHSLVERWLYEEVGELAGKLHTGRSRNDQVATDARLWAMAACEDLRHDVARLEAALLSQAERRGGLLMPGYTHLRRAQPIRAGLWLLSHFWRLERDRARLAVAARNASVMPLGSGALAGCPFPIDRERLAEELGFSRVSPNSLDAVSDRDWAAELLFALSLLGVHLAGLAEDLILFASAEFGFVRLSAGLTSGSSLLPQKKNPDALELARAKAGAWSGDLAALLAILKGLPSGYNKDLQEDKAILFRTVDAARDLLPVLVALVDTLELEEGRLRDALDEGMLATDLADRLVEGGVPFREAHRRVAKLVRESERDDRSLVELAKEAGLDPSPGGSPFGKGPALSFEASADRRESPGGTGRDALAEQLRQAGRALGGPATQNPPMSASRRPGSA